MSTTWPRAIAHVDLDQFYAAVEILAETGLVASVGLAWNKFLAKIASDFKKPNGFVIIPPGDREAREFLAPLPVARLWGVGPKTRERLNALGFFTIGELACGDAA